ncbi:MAG TPA: hypothetical protein VI136_09175 [Verrucomicrobiae bacterium]
MAEAYHSAAAGRPAMLDDCFLPEMKARQTTAPPLGWMAVI